MELLRKEGFSEPYSLKREHGVIEAEATGEDGWRYEIYIDPKTRRILEKKEDDKCLLIALALTPTRGPG